MTDFVVPKECIGFEMPDGAKYNTKNGHVIVEDFDHATEIRKSLQKQRGQVLYHYSFRGAPGWECSHCSVGMFMWQASCVRCKRPRIEEVLGEAVLSV